MLKNKEITVVIVSYKSKRKILLGEIDTEDKVDEIKILFDKIHADETGEYTHIWNEFMNIPPDDMNHGESQEQYALRMETKYSGFNKDLYLSKL